MKKIIAAINMTIDGFCDHTVLMADEEIHNHYTELLNDAHAILYGRITYQLMEYWRTLKENPSGEKSMDDFAIAIDNIPKIVFSRTLKNTDPIAIGSIAFDPIAIGWDSAKLSNKPVEEVVLEFRQSRNGGSKDILIGSRSLIMNLTRLNLIDEYQLCVHPVVVGKGLQLFEGIQDRTIFKLLKTKIFKSGAIILYYGRS